MYKFSIMIASVNSSVIDRFNPLICIRRLKHIQAFPVRVGVNLYP